MRECCPGLAAATGPLPRQGLEEGASATGMKTAMTPHFPLGRESRSTSASPAFALDPGLELSHGCSCCCPRQACSANPAQSGTCPGDTVTSRSPDNSLVYRDKMGSLPGRRPTPNTDIMTFLWVLSCFALLGTAFGERWGRWRPGRLSPSLKPARGRSLGESLPSEPHQPHLYNGGAGSPVWISPASVTPPGRRWLFLGLPKASHPVLGEGSPEGLKVL